MLSGVFYTGAARYAGIAIKIIISAILARLIDPKAFGLVAVTTFFTELFAILSVAGITPAIIQFKDLSKRELNQIFSFTVWTATILSVLFYFSADGIAAFYGKPQLVTLCRILSLNLFFAAINTVPHALLYRDKRFRFIAVRTFVIQIVVGAFAVIAAFNGAGVYALLINPVVSAILVFCINIRQYPLRFTGSFGFHAMRRIFSFSAYQFSFNLINYFARSLDKPLVAKFMDMSVAGFYDKSYQLMMLPLQNITAVISPVMHPVLSNYQHDYQKLSDSYRQVVKVLAFIGFPLAVLLWFTASDLILVIYGDMWEPSVPVFRILSLSVGIQVVLSSSGSIFQAAGNTRMLFLSGIFSTFVTISGVLIGLFIYGTVEAVAWSVVISFALNFVQCYYLMYKRLFHMSWIPFWQTFLMPLALSACMCAVLLLYGWLIPPLPLFIQLVLKSCLGLIVYLGFIQLSGTYDWIGMLRNRFKKNGR